MAGKVMRTRWHTLRGFVVARSISVVRFQPTMMFFWPYYVGILERVLP